VQLELGQLDLKYCRLRAVDRGRHRKMVASLSEHRQQVPVLVVASEQPQSWVLIDGYVRVQALRELSSDTVLAWAPEQLSETQGLVWRQRSALAAHPSALEEGWLVRELVDGHGYEPAEVARDLGRSISWVSRRLGLVETLPAIAQQAVLEGRMCAYGASKYLVPLARANSEQCSALMSALGRAHFSSRQLGTLYESWRSADAVGRRNIVQRPLAVLKLHGHDERGFGEAGAAMLRELKVMARASGRVREHLEAVPRKSWTPGLTAAWQRALSSALSLQRAVEEARHD
jgi:ParB family chromosome partitioning protein